MAPVFQPRSGEPTEAAELSEVNVGMSAERSEVLGSGGQVRCTAHTETRAQKIYCIWGRQKIQQTSFVHPCGCVGLGALQAESRNPSRQSSSLSGNTCSEASSPEVSLIHRRWGNLTTCHRGV